MEIPIVGLDGSQVDSVNLLKQSKTFFKSISELGHTKSLVTDKTLVSIEK